MARPCKASSTMNFRDQVGPKLQSGSSLSSEDLTGCMLSTNQRSRKARSPSVSEGVHGPVHPPHTSAQRALFFSLSSCSFCFRIMFERADGDLAPPPSAFIRQSSKRSTTTGPRSVSRNSCTMRTVRLALEASRPSASPPTSISMSGSCLACQHAFGIRALP